ncbi:MAG: HlyD family type I secretion periplasmic adaptor subunit [Pseudorhodoplanes sp.]
MTNPKKSPLSRNTQIAPYMFGGMLVTVLMVGGVGVWAATTHIAGAVVAHGTVVVESSEKKVQHPTGGVVGAILVKNGDRVRANDLLLRLDETVARANVQMVTKQLDQLSAREARLKAERDDSAEIVMPVSLKKRANESGVAEIIAGETNLFESRLKTREGQKAQLRERISQLDDEYSGINAQIAAKQRELELIAKELEGLETLEERKLVRTEKMTSMRREVARLEGEKGQLQAAAASTKGKISETELQILRIDQELKTEVATDLRETQTKQAEYVERRTAANDQLTRINLLAPQDGIVHQLSVHTVGGVVNPGEPIMLIVPDSDKLVIEAKIAPQDIDQIFKGQPAMIRFGAFDHRSTPELQANVIGISANVTQSQQTGEVFYTARVELPETQIKRLGAQKLLPGMPADVQIRTRDRTAISYLLKPLEDQIVKAFRER